MSISRHNVATLRRNLGIAVSAQGPEKVWTCKIKGDWAQNNSQEIFSGCLAWYPCFSELSTRLWRWR